VLAVSDGHTFFVESNFDALTKISSIMLIQQSDKEGDGPMEVLFEYERIIIVLPKGDFRDYKIAKMNELAATSLTCTIVLPALIEALHLVKSGDDVTENLRWRKILDRRITELGMTNESMDPLFVAQQLLDLPIRRALSVSKSMIEAV
jgi:hypothetical protein